MSLQFQKKCVPFNVTTSITINNSIILLFVSIFDFSAAYIYIRHRKVNIRQHYNTIGLTGPNII